MEAKAKTLNSMSKRSRVPQVSILRPGIAQIFFLELVLTALPACGITATAQTADQAWLRYQGHTARVLYPRDVRALGTGAIEKSAVQELRRNLGDLVTASLSARAQGGLGGQTVIGTAEEVRKAFPGVPVPAGLEPDGYWIYSAPCSDHYNGCGELNLIVIAGGDERGALYGAFALLRFAASADPGESRPANLLRGRPAMPIRWVDEWDNPDGTIERGYAGRSIFFEGGNVREDLAPVSEYARLLASVGINGCNINNVNGASPFLTSEWLHGVVKIADAMRPWGVHLAMSIDIANPQKIGGLSTYDPLDPIVRDWWIAKVNEIYALIPDFAGFTVKADSEGQPGPSSYGRTPADAANLLAAALQPHGGIVLYRAFVYNHHLDWRDPKADRARAAYDIFHPLDGKFAPNVVIQTKEGPIDFQAQEPVSPLFAGLRQTSQALEVEVTQEYTGQQRHLVYLAPMWKQVLDFDLRADGRSTPVKKIVAGTAFHQPLGGMVAVAGVGRDAWLGSPLAMANLYAFGRLAWNPDLAPEQIAAEWTRQTIGIDPEVVRTVVNMLMQSWPAYVNYTGPLGAQTLTDITGSHYGPNIESSEGNGWGQWHRDNRLGIGMDRTVATGTGFIGQYPPEAAKTYESLATTPDDLLLFFHHVPYTYRLHSGKTVIQHIYDSHYAGATQAAQFVKDWATLEGRIDQPLYEQTRDHLVYQAGHAIVWRDAIVQYFLKQSGIPDNQGRAGHYPGRLEAEDARLGGYKVIDIVPWEDASGGKAISCQGSTLGPPETPDELAAPIGPSNLKSCTADWTWTGPAGRYNIAVQYFDFRGASAGYALVLNSHPIDTWLANANLPSTRPNGDNSTRRTISNVELKTGDVLRVRCIPPENDPAALDYIEVTPAPQSRN